MPVNFIISTHHCQSDSAAKHEKMPTYTPAPAAAAGERARAAVMRTQIIFKIISLTHNHLPLVQAQQHLSFGVLGVSLGLESILIFVQYELKLFAGSLQEKLRTLHGHDCKGKSLLNLWLCSTGVWNCCQTLTQRCAASHSSAPRHVTEILLSDWSIPLAGPLHKLISLRYKNTIIEECASNL